LKLQNYLSHSHTRARILKWTKHALQANAAAMARAATAEIDLTHIPIVPEYGDKVSIVAAGVGDLDASNLFNLRRRDPSLVHAALRGRCGFTQTDRKTDNHGIR
jgi:hypothetical protein